MDRHIEDLIDKHASHRPTLWKRCYPRIYQGISEYESPRYVALTLASSLEWVTELEAKKSSLTAQHIAIAATSALKNNLPSFFVDRVFLNAAMQTDLPDDTRWVDIKLPYEAGLIYLPKDQLKDPSGDSINVIGWSRNRKDEEILIMGEKQGTKYRFTDDTFTVFGISDATTQRYYSSAVQAGITPYIKWDSHQQGKPGPFDLEVTEEDSEFLTQIDCLVFALLMAQTIRPALTTDAKREGFHRKSQREIWTPNFLGRGYQPRRQQDACNSTTDRTENPPRTHWRRGHYRWQPVGNYQANEHFVSASSLRRNQNGTIDWSSISEEARKSFLGDHKHIWIEPILIG